MGQIKPFGVMLGLLGSVMIALSIAKLIETGSCGGEFAAPCPDELTPYVLMLPAGIIVAVAAIFFGGGFLIFLGVFLSVGIGSLIAGFSSESADTAGFGKVFGGTFAAVPIILLLGMLWARRSLSAKMAVAQNLVATGARGIGTVTEVRDTGITINDDPRVEVVMSVEPEDGSAAFEARKTITVSRVAIPRQGERHPVFYDRADPAKWAYGTDVDPQQATADIRALFARAAGAAAVAATEARSPAGDHGPADELLKLNDLRLKGVLTDAEFEIAKGRLLGTATPPTT